MSGSRVLCRLDELADPGSRGFRRGDGEDTSEIFVVRVGSRVYGYRNHCPHTGAPLEWQPDQFLDFEGSFIQCAFHGALFVRETGYCVRGPCSGRSLEPFPVRLDDQGLVVCS